MGVDYNAYIGPYLRVMVPVQVVETDFCAEHNRGDVAYCPKCGRSKNFRIGKSEVNQALIRQYKGGDFYDYFYSTSSGSQPPIIEGKRTHIYLPNKYWNELGIPRLSSRKELPLDEMDIRGMVEKFETLFKDEIIYLKQWFGVEVKFGYVSYCS